MAQPKGPLAHMARQTWTKFTKNAKASRRVVPRDRWTHPKDRIPHWKILVGDRVKVISGASKGQIGIVREVDKQNNRIILDNVNLGKKTASYIQAEDTPEDSKNIGSWWMQTYEKPIHVTNVLLVHPEDANDDTKKASEKRAVRVHWRRIEDLSIGKGEFRWRRYIAGTDIQVPIPKLKDPKKEIREDTPWDTSPELTLEHTFKPSFDSPLPLGVIDELRNPHKKWRYLHRDFV
ncbi:970_t:CDS:2 [Paraglomus occultum]|uniref:970_t:CDS:1 n=1 Tax=Paraglomus occultum TaxID=144539 RepID=A0A9N9GFT2_9GLOM|nr:970_t:CDS:2 [Paraglomus occultum]